jgi:hypothetical protein
MSNTTNSKSKKKQSPDNQVPASPRQLEEEAIPLPPEHIDELLKIRNYAEEQFDQLLVYFSAGGLVLTVGFVKEVVPLDSAICKPCLLGCWIMFACSLILILLSQRYTVKSVDARLINKNDEWAKFENKTKTLNKLSFWSLIFGVAFFIIFICINLLFDKKMSKDNNNSPASITHTGVVSGGKTLPSNIHPVTPPKNDSSSGNKGK